MKNRFQKYLKRIIKLIKLEEMQILPGHLAFNMVLMIVPVFSLIGVFGSKLDMSKVSLQLSNNVPNAVLNILDSALRFNLKGANIFIFTLFSIWLVANGCKAIILASNMLFKIKNTSNVKIYLNSFQMVFILFALIGFIIIVPILGDFIMQFLSHYLKDTGIHVIESIYHIIKYPISLILMYFMIKFIYGVAPSEYINSKYMRKGALFTTISWFILSRIYSYHLNNYSKYSLYYGNLANILILLVWVYLMAYIFTIGLSLNADDYLTYKDKK